MTDNVNNFLNPKSITVIGVSRNPQKIGRLIFDQLINEKKQVYGINPNLKKLGNRKIYNSVSQIPKKTDLAIYAIPALLVPSALIEAANKKITNHLIISAGFSELGEAGKILENQIKQIRDLYHLNIQGPNCLGNISTINKFNASFAKIPKKGNIGLILQSGAIGTSFFDWSNKENFGISHFISLGNKAGLTEIDFLEFLIHDSATKVIGIYLEDMANPIKFMELCTKYAKIKPILILKAGKSEQGQIAVSSHTGAMAGLYSAELAAFKQANTIVADNLEEFFYFLQFFSSYFRKYKLDEALVITNAGGPAVLTVDELIKNNIKLWQIPEIKISLFKKVLPANSSVHNPIDILGDANPDRLKKVLDVLKPKTHDKLTIIHLSPQEDTNLVGMAKLLANSKYKFKGVLIVNILGGTQADPARSILHQAGIISFDFANDFIKLINKLNFYEQQKKLIKHEVKLLITDKSIITKARNQLSKFTGFIDEQLSINLAKQYRLPLPPTQFINSFKEAEHFCKKYGFPIALKISDPSIIHRNRENGVYLNISDLKLLENAYNRLFQLHGEIIIQKMIEPDAEIIIGAKRDNEFKYLIMFGSGGIHTEYLKDISFGVLPGISEEDISELISQTKISKLIENKKIFSGLFSGFCTMLNDIPEIDEIDLNPVILCKNKLYCVDIKIKV